MVINEATLSPNNNRSLAFVLQLSRYRPAAATFALTQASFEAVALKFIQVSEQDPLRVFLVKKLNNMDHKVCD